MADYRLSRAADASIAKIYEYSLLNFGEAVADDYFKGLHDAFLRLAEFPRLGRECNEVREACRRFEYRSHVVFYVIDYGSILILDVLGSAQDPLRHL
jgi:toxin ParE1/3/4